MLKVQDYAPEFSLPDQNGVMRSLKDYRGKWVLLYFYPKDDTPGCTAEACALRDNFKELTSEGAVILGVSTDSPDSHKKFAAKYTLPFTLLADVDKSVVKLYGVWGLKKFMGRKYYGTKRMSFLVDQRGKIAKIYDGVKPMEHSREVLEDIINLEG